ncbi:MAG: immunoglobulin domain-containing protein, partial [Pseudomonadota bacterium]
MALMAKRSSSATGYVDARHTSSKNVMQGEDVEIHCEAYGYPTPEVYWMKKTEEMKKPEKLSLSPSWWKG